MSDNLKRYRAIKDGLRQLYPRAAQGHLAQHLNSLAALVSGIVGSKQSQLPLIAAKIPGPTQPASRAKTCSRWINDENNDYDSYYLPFIQILLQQLAQTTLVLIMDSSEVGRKCLTLMLSAV